MPDSVRGRFGPARRGHRARLVALGRRSRQVLLLAGVTGVLVGVVVAAFEWLTAEVLLAAVLRQPLWLQATAPACGLLLAAGALRVGGRRRSPATSDEYIRSFHGSGDLDLRDVPVRLVAAIATLGSGGPLGYEGPALYAGAGVGTAVQRRFRRFFGEEDAKVLLVAGAAAGVAAVFKAPVTGLVFALEVPFQQDLARRMLLPAAIGAAASYVTFAALAGTEPLLPVAGQPPFNLVDLGGAAVVGLAAGVLARLFIALVQVAKGIALRGRPVVRAVAAGAVLAATVLIGDALGGASLALGPGYDALEWALDPGRGLLPVVALGTIRVAGTVAAVAGGGTGGLFIPLVIQGALLGRAVGGAFEVETTTLFPVVGMAAFLGAGYRVPLAAVVFVAEFTGRPGFVVPGLIAAVVSQMVMGRTSISPYQRDERMGHIERRLRLPVAAIVERRTDTVTPDATVEEVFWHNLVGGHRQAVVVLEDHRYRGMLRASDLAAVHRDAWPVTRVGDVLCADVPAATMDQLVVDAVRLMGEWATDRIAVCDGGAFVGVVTAADLVRLDDLLAEHGSRGR